MGILAAADVRLMVATVNELANATLLEISEPGPLAGNGDPGTPVKVWAGEAPGLLMRARRETNSGDRETPIRSDTFRVYDQVAPAVEYADSADAATTVVIRDETRSVVRMSRWTVKGAVKETEGTLDSITLELESETAP